MENLNGKELFNHSKVVVFLCRSIMSEVYQVYDLYSEASLEK